MSDPQAPNLDDPSKEVPEYDLSLLQRMWASDPHNICVVAMDSDKNRVVSIGGIKFPFRIRKQESQLQPRCSPTEQASAEPKMDRTPHFLLADMQQDRKLFGLAKLYVCLVSLHTAWSLLAGMPHPDHIFVLTLTVLVVALGVLDAVVNDLMPSKYCVPTVFRWKYVIFIALAGGQMSLIYQAVSSYRADFSTLRYALDAAAAVVVAVLDLKARWVSRNESSAVTHSVA